ncbi:MAG: transcriptional regulator, GntR family [Roseibaca calidilacus]|uniref:Transcriptional regulator, GntR family n=1 Tax=Roseibaca calidilacus TaxID=1666912 RepID=A0A0P7W8M3_9RHOB|nr:PLP-dependent aminotransferase family protein [Roseibaca calidilacus]KPP90486.1 MAG: transcriptional regulator, GntR family [Roseibaca calidilacus]CUX83293.1 transcriptional regulator, GntR family [Roseibaca calidilacus]
MDTILQHYMPGGGRSKFRDVVAAIRSAIAQGSLAPGDQLPPVRDLAWKLDMTPGTVARAYAALTDEGITEGQVGRGTFIAPPSTPVQFVPEPWFDAGLAIEAEADDQVSLFATALPDMGQVALIHSAFARLGSRSPRDLLAYPSRSTFEPARRAVLHWLSGAALGPIDHEDLVLSHGGQSGVSLVMQSVLHGRKPVVLLEELTYPGFRRAAQLLRADVVSVPMDAQGIIPEALAELAQKHDAQLLCTCPEVHNPTGIFTPEERRIQIAEVAAQHGLHILEDDCYRVGDARASSYRALLPELGWYVSSLSKSLTPALRIGFTVAPRAHASTLRRAAEHGFFGLARPLADLTEDLLLRPETAEVAEKVRACLQSYTRVAVNGLGGYDLRWGDDIPFLWLNLPDGWRAGSFTKAAASRGVQLRSAEDFALRDARVPHAVRIGINAQIALPRFENAIARLRDLLDNPPEGMVV